MGFAAIPELFLMPMNEKHRGPRACSDRCGPEDFNLFARMLGVRQESAMHHPAVAMRQGPWLDRRTAHQQTHSQ
jgi:hypothetical protein